MLGRSAYADRNRHTGVVSSDRVVCPSLSTEVHKGPLIHIRQDLRDWCCWRWDRFGSDGLHMQEGHTRGRSSCRMAYRAYACATAAQPRLRIGRLCCPFDTLQLILLHWVARMHETLRAGVSRLLHPSCCLLGKEVTRAAPFAATGLA